MLLLIFSCSFDNDMQEESNFTVQSVLNNQSITLPSIEKTLGTASETTQIYSSENGYVTMTGASFIEDGYRYYPLDIAADLMVRRWVKKENNGKTIYSPLWSYLCTPTNEENFIVVSYSPDAHFLQTYELDEEVCKKQLPMHEKYSGTVFESTLDGSIIGGAIYSKGEKTWMIEPENIEHVSSKCLVQRNGSNILSLLILNYNNTRANYEGWNSSAENFSIYCDACGEIVDSCSCIRCPKCEERLPYCNCLPYDGCCEWCHQDPCKCAICKTCGKKEPECTCPPPICLKCGLLQSICKCVVK